MWLVRFAAKPAFRTGPQYFFGLIVPAIMPFKIDKPLEVLDERLCECRWIYCRTSRPVEMVSWCLTFELAVWFAIVSARVASEQHCVASQSYIRIPASRLEDGTAILDSAAVSALVGSLEFPGVWDFVPPPEWRFLPNVTLPRILRNVYPTCTVDVFVVLEHRFQILPFMTPLRL